MHYLFFNPAHQSVLDQHIKLDPRTKLQWRIYIDKFWMSPSALGPIVFITVRKRSCGKVMFSQACVKNSVHMGEVYTPLGRHPSRRHPSRQTLPLGKHPPGQTQDTPPGRHPTPLGRHPSRQTPPLIRQGCCSGWYTSYWNASCFHAVLKKFWSNNSLVSPLPLGLVPPRNCGSTTELNKGRHLSREWR